MHAGQPPLRHDLRLRDVLQIDDGEDVIRVAVEVHGQIRIAAAGPPQAVDAEAGDLEKRDLAHVRGLRDVVDAQPRSKLLPVRDAVGERVLEVAAHVVVRLHGDDVRAVREQQEIAGHLQVVRARVGAGREEADGLEAPRIGGVENRHAVAEHVADVEVLAVEHHLHAVGPAALVAIREVANLPADALGRHRRVHCGNGRAGRGRGRGSQRQQSFQMFAAGPCHRRKDSTPSRRWATLWRPGRPHAPGHRLGIGRAVSSGRRVGPVGRTERRSGLPSALRRLPQRDVAAHAEPRRAEDADARARRDGTELVQHASSGCER